MRSYLQKHDKIKYSNHWATPIEIYEHYINVLEYYDPCKLYDDSFNLKDYTKDYGNMFINPPYENIKDWVNYAITYSYIHNRNVTLLIPSRTDTKYFHDLLNYGVDLEFIKGRLKFGGSKYGAPFPSVLVHLKGKE